MQEILEGVEKLTGFCGAAMFCGPEPARGGRFTVYRSVNDINLPFMNLLTIV
jgi:hypothetical protein